jgi:hypothetical protein
MEKRDRPGNDNDDSYVETQESIRERTDYVRTTERRHLEDHLKEYRESLVQIYGPNETCSLNGQILKECFRTQKGIFSQMSDVDQDELEILLIGQLLGKTHDGCGDYLSHAPIPRGKDMFVPSDTYELIPVHVRHLMTEIPQVAIAESIFGNMMCHQYQSIPFRSQNGFFLYKNFESALNREGEILPHASEFRVYDKTRWAIMSYEMDENGTFYCAVAMPCKIVSSNKSRKFSTPRAVMNTTDSRLLVKPPCFYFYFICSCFRNNNPQTYIERNETERSKKDKNEDDQKSGGDA